MLISLSLTFISFKIDTNETIHTLLSDKNFWPSNCKIKDFQHKNRPIAEHKRVSVASSANFLAMGQSRKVTT